MGLNNRSRLEELESKWEALDGKRLERWRDSVGEGRLGEKAAALSEGVGNGQDTNQDKAYVTPRGIHGYRTPKSEEGSGMMRMSSRMSGSLRFTSLKSDESRRSSSSEKIPALRGTTKAIFSDTDQRKNRSNSPTHEESENVNVLQQPIEIRHSLSPNTIVDKNREMQQKELSGLVGEIEQARKSLESVQMEHDKEKNAMKKRIDGMAKELERQLEEREQTFLQEQEEKREELEILLTQNRRLKEDLDVMQRESTAKAEELMVKERNLMERMERFSKEYQVTNDSLKSREERLDACESEIEQIRASSRDMERKSFAIQNKEQTINQMFADLASRLSKQEQASREVEELRKALEKEKQDLKQKKEDLEFERTCMLEELTSKEASLSEWEAKIQHQHVLQSELDALEKDLEVKRRILNNLQNQLEQEQSNVDTAMEVLSSAEEKQISLQQKEANIKKREDDVSNLENSLSWRRKEIESKENNLKERSLSIKESEENIGKELERIASKSKALEEERERLRLEFADLEDRLETFNREDHSLRVRKSTLETEMSAHFNAREAILNNMKQDLDQRQNLLESKQDELQEMMEEMEVDFKNRERNILAFEEYEASTRKELETFSDTLQNEKNKIDLLREDLGRKENELDSNVKAIESERLQIHSERMEAQKMCAEGRHALEHAEMMKSHVANDRLMLESREEKVRRLEKETESLHREVTERTAKLAAAIDRAVQREMEAASRLKEAQAMMTEAVCKQSSAEELVSKWKTELQSANQRAEEAERLSENAKKQQSSLESSASALRIMERDLKQREWKLHDYWRLLKSDIISTMQSQAVKEDDTIFSIIQQDVLQEDIKAAEAYFGSDKEGLTRLEMPKEALDHEKEYRMHQMWSNLSQRESVLQRWAVSLALSSSHHRDAMSRLQSYQKELKEDKMKAQQDRQTAEKLLEEIQERELEIQQAMSEIEARENRYEQDRQSFLEDRKMLQQEKEELQNLEKEVESKSKALKSLEASWKDRIIDVKDRERALNESLKRLQQQRETLESREAQLVEDEAGLRDQLMQLSSKRVKLEDLEQSLIQKQKDLEDREYDADELLQHAREERDESARLLAEYKIKLRNIEEKSAELEILSSEVDGRMHLSESLETKETKLHALEHDLHSMKMNLSEREESIVKIESSLNDQATEISLKMQDLEERELKIVSMETNLSTRENELAEKEIVMSERSDALMLKEKELEQSICEANERKEAASRICSRESNLQLREKELDRLEEDLHAKNNTLKDQVQRLESQEKQAALLKKDLHLQMLKLEEEQQAFADDMKTISATRSQLEHARKLNERREFVLRHMHTALQLKLSCHLHVVMRIDECMAEARLALSGLKEIFSKAAAGTDEDCSTIYLLNYEQNMENLKKELSDMKRSVREYLLHSEEQHVCDDTTDHSRQEFSAAYFQTVNNTKNGFCANHTMSRLKVLESIVQSIGNQPLSRRLSNLRAELVGIPNAFSSIPSPPSNSDDSLSFLTSDDDDDDIHNCDRDVLPANDGMLSHWEARFSSLIDDTISILQQQCMLT